jgi:hypothetical protein
MLKKLITLSTITLLLASCEPASKRGADGYSFGQPQYEKQQVQINVVTYKSNADLRAAAKARGVDIPEIAAFSELRPPFDTCTVHMVDPRVSYEPEFIGHEFAHCIYGQWHTDNNSRK